MVVSCLCFRSVPPLCFAFPPLHFVLSLLIACFCSSFVPPPLYLYLSPPSHPRSHPRPPLRTPYPLIFSPVCPLLYALFCSPHSSRRLSK